MFNFTKSLKRYWFTKKFSGSKELKLNLGCGADHKKDWINIDSGEQFGNKGLSVRHNLAKGVPFADGSVDYIYHEHFIEHLTRKQGLRFLKDCYRTLKRQGVMRIACPDLNTIIEDYLQNKFHDREWLQKIATEFQGKSSCELFNICMREWGHQYIYDHRELQSVLQEAGFDASKITICTVGQSSHSVLSHLETREDSLVLEAQK